MRSFRRTAALMAAGALAVAWGAASAAAQSTALRYSQWIPKEHFTQVNGLHKYFAEIEKATGGRVRIEPTAQGLGAPARHMQLAADGIADLGWSAHGYQPGTYPLSEIAELPFITKSTTANSVAYWRVYKAMFEAAGMHPATVHTLTVHVHPAGHVYNSRRPVTTVDGFKGLKLRSVNTITTRAFDALGAVPLAMPSTAARDALAKGTADGTAFTDEALFNFKLNEFVKHATRIEGGIYNTSFYLVMNKKKWDAIAKPDQDAIMALSGEALGRRLGQIWDAEETAAAPKLKAQGVTYDVADAALMGRLKEILGPFEAEWIEKAKKAGVDGAAALALFRAEIAKN